jgi:hypothetical protein
MEIQIIINAQNKLLPIHISYDAAFSVLIGLVIINTKDLSLLRYKHIKSFNSNELINSIQGL